MECLACSQPLMAFQRKNNILQATALQICSSYWYYVRFKSVLLTLVIQCASCVFLLFCVDQTIDSYRFDGKIHWGKKTNNQNSRHQNKMSTNVATNSDNNSNKTVMNTPTLWHHTPQKQVLPKTKQKTLLFSV